MKYMGSKRRIAKYILPIILKDRKWRQCYVEPFVGGANIIDKVDGYRVGADINKHLILALKAIRDFPKSLPSVLTEQEYKAIKKNGDGWLRGYCGFALSYGGKWFGGWCRDKEGSRDYVAEAFRGAQKQSKNIQEVEFRCCSYDKLEIPPNSIIYCDPPYQGTTKYKNRFDHNRFWQWCRNKTKEGHSVFISEYSAPDDFVCVWSKEINSSLTADTGSKKAVEKLFTYGN